MLRLFVKIGKMLSGLGLQRLGADKKADDKNIGLIAEACLYITESCLSFCLSEYIISSVNACSFKIEELHGGMVWIIGTLFFGLSVS